MGQAELAEQAGLEAADEEEQLPQLPLPLAQPRKRPVVCSRWVLKQLAALR